MSSLKGRHGLFLHLLLSLLLSYSSSPYVADGSQQRLARGALVLMVVEEKALVGLVSVKTTALTIEER